MEKHDILIKNLMIIKSFIKPILNLVKKIGLCLGLFMVCLLGFNYFVNGVQPTNIQLLIVLLLMLDK